MAWNPANARIVYDRLSGSMANRPNALTLVISSAEYNRVHLGYELFQRALEIQRGEREDLHTLACVFALPDDEDWTDENNWWATSLVVTAMVEELVINNSFVMNLRNQKVMPVMKLGSEHTS